jgi:hypothetical protein
MVSVPIDADPRQRAWRQLMHHVGLAESTPMPVQRASAGVGIGPTIGGREVNPPPRPRPPVEHMRSERPAPGRRCKGAGCGMIMR